MQHRVALLGRSLSASAFSPARLVHTSRFIATRNHDFTNHNDMHSNFFPTLRPTSENICTFQAESDAKGSLLFPLHQENIYFIF